MKALAIAAMAVTAMAGAAAASTVTYTETFESSTDLFTFPDRALNVTWYDSNKGLYSDVGPEIVLGDDGWTGSIDFVADAGTTFTPLSFDASGWLGVDFAPYVPGVDDPYDVPASAWSPYVDPTFMSVTGYSGGSVVAQTEVDPNGTITLGSEFAGIEQLTISLLSPVSMSPEGVLVGDTWYRCSSGYQCYFATVDNLTFSVPSAVPLPASAPLLLAAVAGVGLLRRRRR
jgi:hypothetical protein